MFGGWFSEKLADSEDTGERPPDSRAPPGVPPGRPNDNRQRSSSLPVGPQLLQQPTSLELRKTTSASGIGPHDAIIGEVEEKLREIQAADRLSTAFARLRQSSPNTDSLDAMRETSHLRSRIPENMYDPFSGQSIGNLAPGEFEEAEDDLWTHLGRIRELQSEIAVMHSQMENLGDNERSHQAEHSGDDETVNAEEEAKAAKAAEFAKLADRFNGRKDAIDAMMSKLETLSHAINDFHSSRTPVFQIGSSRSTMADQIPEMPTAKSSNDTGGHVLNRILSDAHGEGMLKESPESTARSLIDQLDS